MTQTPSPPKGIGTATLTLAGIAAAFGVAACCALPILFASAGIGAAWLGGVAIVAAPYRTPLLLIGALCLLAGAAETEPMDPLTMARNMLEKPGGTFVPYTAEEFALSIYFWSGRATAHVHED